MSSTIFRDAANNSKPFCRPPISRVAQSLRCLFIYYAVVIVGLVNTTRTLQRPVTAALFSGSLIVCLSVFRQNVVHEISRYVRCGDGFVDDPLGT